MKITDIVGTHKHKHERGPRKHRHQQQELEVLNAEELFDFDEELEEASKNTHLDHAEEVIFIQGAAGLERVIDTFEGLLRTVDGGENGPAVTTKWDGAPAVFCGIDPTDGEFFVGTKGVFAKNPKLNKSQADIDTNHPDTTDKGEPVSKQGLRDKLSASLNYLKDLNIKGVLQGDLLFTKGDIRTVTLDGAKHIVFKPNTITYVVPANSKLAKEMLQAEIGIVFHTSYEGETIQDMTASFGFNADSLTKSPKVWFTDARIKDVAGQVQFSDEEVAEIKTGIKRLKNLDIDKRAFDILDAQIPIDLVVELKAHANTPIRSGQALEKDPMVFANSFIEKIDSKFEEAINKLKTGREGRAGQAKIAKQEETRAFLEANKQHIVSMYIAYLEVEAIKMMFQRKMREIKAIDSFIEQPDGSFKVTDPEGFVIADHTGGAMKVVDRIEFSAANFQKD